MVYHVIVGAKRRPRNPVPGEAVTETEGLIAIF